MKTYEVIDFSGTKLPEDILERTKFVAGITAVLDAIKECDVALVSSETWGNGHIQKYLGGKVVARCFPGCDGEGFGGEAPYDARLVIIWLKRETATA